MSSINIYAILESKPNNPHYLKRYYKFIQFCQEINQNIDENEYMEEHHICPKAEDLFPEYKSFKHNPWNKINLTFRQHIICHLMLAKAYRKSQIYALYFLLKIANPELNHKFSANRSVPSKKILMYLENARKQNAIERKNFKHSEESIAKMVASKLKYKKIILYCLNAKTKISAFDDNLNEYLAQGWLPFLAGEDRELRKLVANKKASDKTKGNCRFMYQDGTYYGVIKTDDPIIQELNLVPHVTENQRKQMVKWGQAAADSNRGTNIYNNGVDEARFDEDPGGEWKIGRLPRSPEWDKKQKEATSKQGHKFWNNGVECRLLKPDETVPEGWVPGMIKRGPRKN